MPTRINLKSRENWLKKEQLDYIESQINNNNKILEDWE